MKRSYSNTSFTIIDIVLKYDATELKPLFITLQKNKKVTILESNSVLDEFIAYLISLPKNPEKKEQFLFYTQNLNFLALALLKYKKLHSVFEIKPLLERGSFYYLNLTVKNTKKSFVFKCGTKFFPTGVKNILLKLNLPHPYDISLYNWNSEEGRSKTELIRISKVNIFALRELLVDLDKNLKPFLPNWGAWCYSTAAASIQIYFKYYGKKENIQRKEKEHDLFSSLFVGAITEVYGNLYDDETLYTYDENNMYGNVMEDSFYYGNWQMHNADSIKEGGAYYVTLEARGLYIPTIPIKNIYDQQLYFTNGRVTNLLWDEEINFALQKGYKLIEIHFFYKFECKDYIFKSFISMLKALRKESKFGNFLFKSLIVGFYGRLGMGQKKTKTVLVNQDNYHKNDINLIKNELWIGDHGLIEITIDSEETIIKMDKLPITATISINSWYEKETLNLSIELENNCHSLLLNKLTRLHTYTLNGESEAIHKEIIGLHFNSKANEDGIKLVLNGNKGKTETCVILTLDIWEHQTYCQSIILKGPLLKKNFKNIKFNGYLKENTYLPSDLILASQISMKARLRLRKTIAKLENLGGRLLYCDTDSVFIGFNKDSENIIKSLPLDPKNSKKIIDAVFISNKCYALKFEDGSEDIKISGLALEEPLTFDKLKLAFYENTNLTLQNIKQQSRFQFTQEKELIQLRLNNYKKREFSKDKKKTRPLYTNHHGDIETDPNF